jgi:VanZ family protein
MMAEANPDLRYRKLWLFIGYAIIALVVYLSLTSSPVHINTGLPYQDKLLHVLAYFGLTFWFLQIYHIRHHRLGWVIFFISLGLLLEYLQGFDPKRYTEAGDMFANALGVVAAVVLSGTARFRFVLVNFERLVTR